MFLFFRAKLCICLFLLCTQFWKSQFLIICAWTKGLTILKKKINVEGLVLNNTRNCPSVKVICHVICVTLSLSVILLYVLASYLCQVLVSLLLRFLCFLQRFLCLAAVSKLLRLFILFYFFFFVVKCRSCER